MSLERFGDNRSRGQVKLSAAIERFGLDVAGWVCADLGANVGGFTRELLSHGAKRVYAVDTGYGVLEYDLRRNERVAVLERTNALRVTLPELCDLVVIDLGWTRQKLILPKARELIGPDGRIITLIKPQYEADPSDLIGGVLAPEKAVAVVNSVIESVPQWSLEVIDHLESPIRGKGGNVEYLALLKSCR